MTYPKSDLNGQAGLNHPGLDDDPKVWKTKDGRYIPIPHLESTHLINIVNMLIRSFEIMLERALIKAYSFESQCRDEMAQETVAMEIYRLEGSTPRDFLEYYYPPWPHLVHAIFGRGLQGRVDWGNQGPPYNSKGKIGCNCDECETALYYHTQR